MLKKFVDITAHILLFFDDEIYEEGIDDPYVVACRKAREEKAARASIIMLPVNAK